MNAQEQVVAMGRLISKMQETAPAAVSMIATDEGYCSPVRCRVFGRRCGPAILERDFPSQSELDILCGNCPVPRMICRLMNS